MILPMACCFGTAADSEEVLEVVKRMMIDEVPPRGPAPVMALLQSAP